jgi:hypothetical protein
MNQNAFNKFKEFLEEAQIDAEISEGIVKGKLAHILVSISVYGPHLDENSVAMVHFKFKADGSFEMNHLSIDVE